MDSFQVWLRVIDDALPLKDDNGEEMTLCGSTEGLAPAPDSAGELDVTGANMGTEVNGSKGGPLLLIFLLLLLLCCCLLLAFLALLGRRRRRRKPQWEQIVVEVRNDPIPERGASLELTSSRAFCSPPPLPPLPG